jgi:hypothetical protein
MILCFLLIVSTWGANLTAWLSQSTGSLGTEAQPVIVIQAYGDGLAGVREQP